MKNILGKVEYTERGFARIDFEDRNGEKCSLQQSSAGSESCIWLGVTKPRAQFLHGDAKKVGVETTAFCGWVDYPIPPEVSLFSRMHLNEAQVKALIGHLQTWLKECNRF
jgi:hypothetical protein